MTFGFFAHAEGGFAEAAAGPAADWLDRTGEGVGLVFGAVDALALAIEAVGLGGWLGGLFCGTGLGAHMALAAGLGSHAVVGGFSDFFSAGLAAIGVAVGLGALLTAKALMLPAAGGLACRVG